MRLLIGLITAVCVMPVQAGDVEFSGVDYSIEYESVALVGRIKNNTGRSLSVDITYGCDDAAGNMIDMYSFPLQLAPHDTKPFKRRQVKYTRETNKCWVRAD